MEAPPLKLRLLLPNLELWEIEASVVAEHRVLSLFPELQGEALANARQTALRDMQMLEHHLLLRMKWEEIRPHARWVEAVPFDPEREWPGGLEARPCAFPA